MLEKVIEKYLVEQVKKRGGICEKFTSPGRRSVPDRIITMAGGQIVFVEVKSSTGKVTEGQALDHAMRRKLGCHVCVVNSKEDVDLLLNGMVCSILPQRMEK